MTQISFCAPLDPRTACRNRQAFGCSLPPQKIVDSIHANATVRLEPRPLTLAARRSRPSRSTTIIEEQRKAHKKLGEMISGIKKDLVLSNRLEEKTNRVAIYGWHRLDGKPIQPLNVSHVRWYVDYSHGARLIKRQVEIDGKPRDLRMVLNSEKWSPFSAMKGRYDGLIIEGFQVRCTSWRIAVDDRESQVPHSVLHDRARYRFGILALHRSKILERFSKIPLPKFLFAAY